MKLFIASIITVILICGLCIYSTVMGTNAINGMLCELEAATPEGKKVPENADEVCKRLQAKWEDSSFMLSMLLPHHHLDSAKEKIVSLNAYAVTDEFAEWNDATLALREELSHIRGLLKANADNIF